MKETKLQRKEYDDDVKWECEICGQIVMTATKDGPESLKWADGHVCSFRRIQ